MPSEEFMKAVLSQASTVVEESAGEVELEEEASEEVEEDAAEEVEAEDEEEGEGEDAEAEEAEDEEAPEDDESDADEEPEASHEEGEFYLGRYRTREEAERGMDEHIRFAQTKAQEAAEKEKELEYYRGLAEGRAAGGEQDFDDWADRHLMENPERGMIEAIQISRETSDPSYAYAYADRWADADLPRAEYDAAIWRNRLESAVFKAQEETPDPNPAQTVISHVWQALTDEYPDMRDDETVKGISQVIHADEDLRLAAVSADPAQARLAFLAARKAYRLQAARPSNGSPRRTRKADQDRVAADKVAATVSTGDGAPSRRTSSPDFDPEEQKIFEGAEKMGLKLRET